MDVWENCGFEVSQLVSRYHKKNKERKFGILSGINAQNSFHGLFIIEISTSVTNEDYFGNFSGTLQW